MALPHLTSSMHKLCSHMQRNWQHAGTHPCTVATPVHKARGKAQSLTLCSFAHFTNMSGAGSDPSLCTMCSRIFMPKTLTL